MLSIFTSGPTRIDITPRGGGVGGLIFLAAAAVGVGEAVRHAHGIGQAVTITAAVLFGLVLAAVITMAVLLVLRIRRELRGLRRMPAPVRAIPAAVTVRSVEVTSRPVRLRAVSAGVRERLALGAARPSADPLAAAIIPGRVRRDGGR